ncbi:MAG: dihydropteroate synthase [Alphaproteobacteria bacterium]
MPRGFSRAARLYLCPIGLATGAVAEAQLAAGHGRRLAGGRFVFSTCEVLVREPDRVLSVVASLADIAAWARQLDEAAARRIDELLARLTASRPPLARLELGRPLVMGVINVTPDSFSDGGDFLNPKAAIAYGRALVEAGADILDVGGESTRPGSDPVGAEEEIRRVVSVVEGLARDGAVVSIDTRRAVVMRRALEAGARMINDVSALTFDRATLDVAAAAAVPVVLMHARGDPKTMQVDPVYDHAPLDIFDYLEARVAACEAAGIPRERLVVDPGIGFGKTVEHNVEILESLSLLHGIGCPILLGVSRKSFIGGLSGKEVAKERLPGSLVSGFHGLSQGVQILRVHDVPESVQALTVWEALTRGA